MHRSKHLWVRAIGTAAATTLACSVLVACTENSTQDDSGLQADVVDPDDEPTGEPSGRLPGRGTPVTAVDHGVSPQPDHAPQVLEPMVAVPFDPDSDEALDSVAIDAHLAQPPIDAIAAQLTVVVELAQDAPTMERAFEAPSAQDTFVTWFAVTEAIAGTATVGETLVVEQALLDGLPKSDGFLRPVPGRRYVLMLDASDADPDHYVIAGGGRLSHFGFLAERDDGAFAYDRGVPMSLDEIRKGRSDR